MHSNHLNVNESEALG